MKRNDPLRDQWASLGVAFATATSMESDPETAIVSLVTSKEFPEDKKMMSIALLWLKEYSTFVHIEKLKIQVRHLDMDALAILGALSLKCVVFGDHRWKTITLLVKKKLGSRKSDLCDDEVFLKTRGIDPDFLKFGIRVTPISPDEPRKLLARKRVIQRNAWLKSRLLFGTNLRADIAALKSLKTASTAYAAAKLLGCSMNAAYRNWNDLTEAGWGQVKPSSDQSP